MKIISVNAGGPRDVAWRGRIVRTSIWKNPVDGRVRVRALNIDGDEQSDLSVHGGEDKAVYVYPSEHYAFWGDFPWGAFGENFTTEGLLEHDVRIGDRLRAGSAEFVVTQPRFPCYKLGIRFGSEKMIVRFLRSGRSGFYLAVLREGDVAAGDEIALVRGERDSPSIADVFTRSL